MSCEPVDGFGEVRVAGLDEPWKTRCQDRDSREGHQLLAIFRCSSVHRRLIRLRFYVASQRTWSWTGRTNTHPLGAR